MVQSLPQLHQPDTAFIYTLREIADALNSPHLRTGLARTLEIIAEKRPLTRSCILIRLPEQEELRLEACRGFPIHEPALVPRSDDTVIDQVIRSGTSAIVQLPGARSMEPPARTTFICTPISAGGKSIGALGADVRRDVACNSDAIAAFIAVVASMIGQALKDLFSMDISEAGLVGHAPDSPDLVGSSMQIRQARERIARVALSKATVLVRGEPGTGRELVARTIHRHSLRKDGPFIKIRCACAHEILKRPALAEGGTIYLEEVTDLNPSMAARLVLLLQDGLGRSGPDLRFVVSSAANLEEQIRAGNFREDLYQALNVFPIDLPPLRDREQDILLLASHFARLFNSRHARRVRRVSAEAMSLLGAYTWPANVRELANTIENAVLLCAGNEIGPHHLPAALQTGQAAALKMSLKRSVEDFEKALICDTLRTTGGNRAQAAKVLRTTERIMNYKVRKYRINCAG